MLIITWQIDIIGHDLHMSMVSVNAVRSSVLSDPSCHREMFNCEIISLFRWPLQILCDKERKKERKRAREVKRE